MKKGRLFVIDGLDGCGKSTQLELLSAALAEKGSDVKRISFPDYDSPSSALVKMYLRGDFSSDAGDINAYAASSFYAVDRYASYKLHWQTEYLSGSTILAARYVSSNAIHQMSKLPENEWDAFLDWLADYEFVRLGLPRPDKVIFLDMPVDIAQKLLASRYDGNGGEKDIHEANLEYMRTCRRSALYAAERLGWTVIDCSADGSPLPVNIIAQRLLEALDA